jgi:hypothetical protein
MVKHDNYDASIQKDMEIMINNFNEEYDWDLMYKIKDVDDRLKSNNKLFILYYQNNPIGCVWFKPINNETTHLYNLYVTKKEVRPKFAPIWFVNICSKLMFDECRNITCECEDWNISAQTVFLKNGFL